MKLLISDCLARTSPHLCAHTNSLPILLEPSPQTLFLETHPAVLPLTETMQTLSRQLRSVKRGGKNVVAARRPLS